MGLLLVAIASMLFGAERSPWLGFFSSSPFSIEVLKLVDVGLEIFVVG